MPVQDVADRYDRQAPAYLESWASVLHMPGRRILAEFEGAGARRVLDVGAGVGSLTPRLQMSFPGATVLSCDGSPGMLALRPDGTLAAVMDASRLAVSPESVDLVLAVFMLFFLEDPVVGLREMRRVLRSGGGLGTVTWGTSMESVAQDVWSECLEACREESGAEDPPTLPDHNDESVDAPEKMVGLLEAAGFASVRSWAEEHATTMDLEHVIRLKTTLGRERLLFETLDPDARITCVERARERLRSLQPDDFVARATIVYATGRAFAPGVGRSGSPQTSNIEE
jgi:ubiquinone/menaquinone biosynthesis C-methylase UbiE